MPTCQRFTPQVQTAGQSNLPVYWFLSFFVGSFSFLICILQFWYVFFLRLGYRRPHLVFMDLLRCVAMKSNHLHLLDYSFFCFIALWRCRLAHAGICLVRWESDFNTSAIGSLNADGSLDHGLFQISDLYWCDLTGQGMDGACGLSCDGIPLPRFILSLILIYTYVS